MIKFTIITPTIGRSTLADAVKSIRDQGYKNVEHLIVYDGPPDAIFSEVFNEYNSRKHKTRVLATGSNFKDFGHSVRSWSIDYATGDYILYMDDDDVYIGDALQKISEFIESTKKLEEFIFFNCLRQGVEFFYIPPGSGRTTSVQYTHKRLDSSGEVIRFYKGGYVTDGKFLDDMIIKYRWTVFRSAPLVQVDRISSGAMF